MSRVRNELSDKNQFKLSKHRFLELKHMCLQHSEWKLKLIELNERYFKSGGLIRVCSDKDRLCAECNDISDLIARREEYVRKIELIEKTAYETDSVIGYYILYAVTHDVGYEYLSMRMNIPCCRNVYYKLYREFFWRLSLKVA